MNRHRFDAIDVANTSGYRSLCKAVIETAVVDVRRLKEDGYIKIKNGKPISIEDDKWPKRKVRVDSDRVANKRILGYYKTPSQVKTLLRYFTQGDAQVELEQLGFDITQETLMKQIGLKQ